MNSILSQHHHTHFLCYRQYIDQPSSLCDLSFLGLTSHSLIPTACNHVVETPPAYIDIFAKSSHLLFIVVSHQSPLVSYYATHRDTNLWTPIQTRVVPVVFPRILVFLHRRRNSPHLYSRLASASLSRHSLEKEIYIHGLSFGNNMVPK